MKFSLRLFSLKNLGHFLKKKEKGDPATLSFHKKRDWLFLLILFFIFLAASFLGHGLLYEHYLKRPPAPTAIPAGVDLKKDKDLYDNALSWLKEREKKYEEVKTMTVPPDPSL